MPTALIAYFPVNLRKIGVRYFPPKELTYYR